VVLITYRVAEFPKVPLCHSWCLSKVILYMMNNRSPAILGWFCHLPESYIVAVVGRKINLLLFLNDIRVAYNSVMITACTINSFTEQNTGFLYRAFSSMYVA